MDFSQLYRSCRFFLASTFSIFLLTACNPKRAPEPAIVTQESVSACHPLYRVIPRYRSEIRWYQVGKWATWALLGNEDDGIFGEEPTAGNWSHRPLDYKRALLWNLRNPLHNFNFYVIGSADRVNSEFTLIQLASHNCAFMKYNKVAKTNFPSPGSCFYFGFHGWKPFLSLRIDYGRIFETYVGWRERGNFGLKLCLAKKKRPPQPTDSQQIAKIP